MAPLAVLAALSLAIVSFACVVSCWGVEAAIPPCHHHRSSCVPLLLTGEAPAISFAADVPHTAAILLPNAPHAIASVFWTLEPVSSISSPQFDSPRFPAVLRI